MIKKEAKKAKPFYRERRNIFESTFLNEEKRKEWITKVWYEILPKSRQIK